MNIGDKLIMLGLAFSLLGSTFAFAKPAPHLEEKTVTGHVPTTGRSGYAHPPSSNAVKDDWSAEMLLG